MEDIQEYMHMGAQLNSNPVSEWMAYLNFSKRTLFLL